MFGSTVLDVLLGLVTIYLTMSLAVTAANELCSQWLEMRPTHWKRAVSQLVDGASATAAKADPGHWFFGQPLLRTMSDNRARLPSYLDKSMFSQILLMAIAPDYRSLSGDELAARLRDKPLADSTRALLLSFLDAAKGDIDAFRAHIEHWYEEVMARASGWYKRNLAMMSLVIAAVIVSIGNVDTLAISHALYGNASLRTAAVQLSGQLQNGVIQAGATAGANGQTVLKAADQASAQAGAVFPLGWDQTPMPADRLAWLSKLLGLVLSALAISLGAPFWFDALSKMTNVRASGPKPA
ncbi:hypothetical protein [Massilia sp. TS11]|uniref:hypothetical protein n=1 Tax=Massilia sp. TS11 TaxID=2908003 RepID=UPI001EDC8F5A|nr:hypothetical protein [Massilia sp. TS11]MCG2583067.1 hypothetical protein [Massilia sp. TS11]